MIQIACLAGSTVLMHFTALYVPSICAVQRRQVVHFDGARARLECTPDLAEVN